MPMLPVCARALAVALGLGLLLAACGPSGGGVTEVNRDATATLASGQTVKAGETFRDCAGCPEMVLIPPGKFAMGSPKGEPGHATDEEPQHAVTFAKPFAVGKYEVTRAEYAAFVAVTGQRPGAGCFYFDGTKLVADPARNWENPGFAQTDRDPVVCLNLAEMAAYAKWLADITHAAYRLPSEAEWEFAARGGTNTARPWGAAIGMGLANCDGCGTAYDARGTAPVGTFAANGFGVFDMLGNVWERVADCYHESYKGAPADGTAWPRAECTQHVTRGGAWLSDAPDVRVALRNWDLAGNRKYTLGFRVARGF